MDLTLSAAESERVAADSDDAALQNRTIAGILDERLQSTKPARVDVWETGTGRFSGRLIATAFRRYPSGWHVL